MAAIWVRVIARIWIQVGYRIWMRLLPEYDHGLLFIVPEYIMIARVLIWVRFIAIYCQSTGENEKSNDHIRISVFNIDIY